jgi:hypothetical protein
MDILAAIKREERKLEKQLDKLQLRLDGVRGAAKAFGAFRRTRSCRREEARFISCWQSGDFKGGEEAVGEG